MKQTEPIAIDKLDISIALICLSPACLSTDIPLKLHRQRQGKNFALLNQCSLIRCAIKRLINHYELKSNSNYAHHRETETIVFFFVFCVNQKYLALKEN